MNTNPNISQSLEDYLEAIYFLTRQNKGVRLTDVAQRLSLSKPSVNRAINTLKDKGLVIHESYGLLSLTDSGLQLAKNIAKRHVLLKNFLKFLGVSENIAEEEACKIEHSLSADTIEKLKNHLYSQESFKEES